MNFTKPTLITLTAPTASGKNYLRDKLESELGFQRIVSTTTRPPRAGEVEGEDYYFISPETSVAMEAAGEFAELITFRGTRYGVTKTEMQGKMSSSTPPMVILEPNGLEVYKKMCTENNWGIFTIYIHASEELRLDRLASRTSGDISKAWFDINNQTIADKIKKLVDVHTDRVLSITGEERRWSNACIFDAIVPGDDGEQAVEMIKCGIINRNRKNLAPAPMPI